MMQKKLIVVALAAAIALPMPVLADNANVTVYGAVDMAFAVTNNGTSAAGVAGTSTNQVSSQVSKLGFKGSEDLGGGLSAIWQIEQQIDADNTTLAASKNTFATRNSFGGLKSDSMGTVLLGRHDTPYKIATRKLDVFGDSLADNRSLMGQAGTHDARPTDVVAYISPAMSGFTAAAAYVAGAETATTSAQVKGSAWSLAGMYDAGPVYASLAYQAFDGGTLGTSSNQTLFDTTVGANNNLKAWKLGGGYTMEALQLNAVYEKTSSSIANVDTLGRTDWYLAGKYSFGSDAVKLAYAHAGEFGATAAAKANTGASQLALGYDHNLSKRTTIYAQYTKLNNGTAASYKITNAGSTAGNFTLPGTGAGASPSAWALGMKHTF